MVKMGHKAFEMTLAFQRGEEEGVEYFFNLLYKNMVYYAFKILNDAELAEDKVVNAFIKIWKSHNTFTHPKVISTWLYTTLRNECLNELATEKRQRQKLVDYTKGNPDIDYNNRLIDIIRVETYAELYKRIDTLPTACAVVFKMMFVEGLTAKEISKQLGLSLSTVKNQKARGLALLRKRFSWT